MILLLFIRMAEEFPVMGRQSPAVALLERSKGREERARKCRHHWVICIWSCSLLLCLEFKMCLVVQVVLIAMNKV
jgi:hypothetical protein